MGWNVTATKLFCDVVKAWVTVMVFCDGTAKCGYCERHSAKPDNNHKAKQCVDPCMLLDVYREDVFQREKQQINRNGN